MCQFPAVSSSWLFSIYKRLAIACFIEERDQRLVSFPHLWALRPAENEGRETKTLIPFVPLVSRTGHHCVIKKVPVRIVPVTVYHSSPVREGS